MSQQQTLHDASQSVNTSQAVTDDPYAVLPFREQGARSGVGEPLHGAS